MKEKKIFGFDYTNNEYVKLFFYLMVGGSAALLEWGLFYLFFQGLSGAQVFSVRTYTVLTATTMQYLDGDVVLFAVPAEECIEIEYRSELRDRGKIKYFGGKEQLIAEGGFDDIDAAMQMHVNRTDDPCGDIQIGGNCNGFITKLIEYHGKAAHAAGAPHLGINALNAAMLGIMGVNAIRETFREQDCVRFHPIITSGGDLVNVIPDLVRMAARTMSAVGSEDLSERVQRLEQQNVAVPPDLLNRITRLEQAVAGGIQPAAARTQSAYDDAVPLPPEPDMPDENTAMPMDYFPPPPDPEEDMVPMKVST